jgi:hypothetical protein
VTVAGTDVLLRWVWSYPKKKRPDMVAVIEVFGEERAESPEPFNIGDHKDGHWGTPLVPAALLQTLKCRGEADRHKQALGTQ